jgi:hypothetical protein
MKKYILFSSIFCCIMTQIQAQCPTQIVDDAGDGGYYKLTLASSAQCSNFPLTSTVTLNGQAYQVASCQNNFGVTLAELAFNGTTPIVLATDAPITFTVGGNTCSYDNMGNPIALPIELESFTGTPSVKGNVLTWKTAAEVNNRGFEVQRLGSDNKWLTLTFIKSKGANGSYTYTDVAPTSISIYRLNQLDNDGKNTYSKVIMLQNGGKTVLKVYPNPVSNILTIETDNLADFEIINLLGQQVLRGKMARSIDVSFLPQGSYFLKMGAEQVKFLKQ